MQMSGMRDTMEADRVHITHMPPAYMELLAKDIKALDSTC